MSDFFEAMASGLPDSLAIKTRNIGFAFMENHMRGRLGSLFKLSPTHKSLLLWYLNETVRNRGDPHGYSEL